MRRERCPRCGAALELEHESWSRGGSSLERMFRCRACGESFSGTLPWSSSVPPSALSTRRGRRAASVAAWICSALAATWLVLRSLDYVARADVYRALSVAGEAFLHPAALVALVAAASTLFTLGRRGRLTAPPSASVAPEVHLRTESPGKMSVVLTGSRDALGRDFVFERNTEAEGRVLRAFESMALRTLAFERGGSRRRSWSQEEIDDARREIYALGLTIGRELLGGSADVGDALADLSGDHLQLAVQPELAAVPWELMVPREGGRFLWQLFSVSRQLRDSVGPAGGARHRSGPARVLLVANPEAGVDGRELPAAEREAADLMELAARRPDALRVVRRSPDSPEALVSLLREDFDVVHFAGHTDEEGRGRWVLSGGGVVDPADAVERSGAPPLFVFANACGSAPGLRGASTADSARSLMRAGVRAYLCTLWELHDAGSADFSGAFYRAAAGATLGNAVTGARNALLSAHPMTWANYVLYGDPTLVLTRRS